MNSYAVSFKFDRKDADAIKDRRAKMKLPEGVKIVNGYKVLGESKGGVIVEGDHEGVQALVRQWRDLLKIRVTPLRRL
jgi:hypothetical protein